MKNNKIKVDGKIYQFNLDIIKELCFVSKNDMLTDTEITDVSSLDEEETDFVNQKVIRETKYYNTQTDVLMQDIIKTFLFKVLDIETLTSDEMSFGEIACFNTCLQYGIITEIKDE